MRLSTQASKTYLDLPSFAEPPEYSIVISADDDEYAGRTKILQRFVTNDDPSDGLDHDGRYRKLLDISGIQTAVELLELGPQTDAAMLRYQIEYADAFAFVFSLYSPKTLDMAQRLRDKIEGTARNHHNIITMSEYERPGMRVPVFLIGNRDGDLAPPQDMEEGTFSPTTFRENAEAEMRALREKAKALAQEWKCAYFEVDTSKCGEEHGVDEAVTGIGHFIRAAERPSTASTTSFSTPMKPPKQYRIRRFLGRMSRMTSFSN
ncbi:Ras-related protein Rap-2c [Cytospora mali]|uniref:Ras-related protein Rap-2c n=1 Tax=Cytospora mali TaxID=578113 RepID=A0A194VS46_CYTMA|nr:Ras-related protein Rap-2c [Valsa mali]